MRNKQYEKPGRPAKRNEPVIARNLITGEETTYANYREAAKATNGNRGVIYMCIHGERKTHLGYEFRLVDFPF